MTSVDDREGRSARLADDVEDSMARAEGILHELRETSHRIRLIRTVQLSVLAATIVIPLAVVLETWLGASTGARWSEVRSVLVWSLPLLAASVASLLSLTRTLYEMREQLQADLRTVVEVSRGVRELLPAISKRNDWSELRVTTMRARLSRFPISGMSNRYE